jgi:RNA polymerase sigma-70 factor (ECF subfamily)
MDKRRAAAETQDAAFEQFIAPHFAALFHRAYRLTGDVDEAEDLVQEACIRAHAALDELVGMNNPTGWLHTVLYHLFVDSRRRDQRLRSVDRGEAEFPEVACAKPGPSEQMEIDLLHRRLRRVMRVLSPIEQALLVMREVEGYSLSEIAAIVELPVTTVRPRLHRAREKLGRLMRPQQPEIVNTRGNDDELPRRQSSAG